MLKTKTIKRFPWIIVLTKKRISCSYTHKTCKLRHEVGSTVYPLLSEREKLGKTSHDYFSVACVRPRTSKGITAQTHFSCYI